MHKKILTIVVASACALPGGLPLAAIDDAGMKYVSGGEGLGGSVRINMSKIDADFIRPAGQQFRDEGLDFGYGESRVYMVGDIELDRGWMATYYFEVRPQEDRFGQRDVVPGSYGSQIRLESQDVGLRGPFGWFRFGRIETASSALVPSADLTNDVGTTGSELADYYDGGLRWVSPDIRGLRLGASVRVKDFNYDNAVASDDLGVESTQQLTANSLRVRTEQDDFQDEAIDEWDLAATYALPQGLGFGVSLAKRIARDRRDEDAVGVRVGASFARDNWGVSYNLHSYRAYNPLGLEVYSDDEPKSTAVGGEDGKGYHYSEYNSSSTAISPGNQLPNGIEYDGSRAVNPNESLVRDNSLRLRGHEDTRFIEHVIGANVSLGRINAALNYSIANTGNEKVDVSPEAGLQALDYDVKSIRADVGYNLGSKSKVIAAYSYDKHEQEGLYDRREYYLMYRVDF